MENDAGTYYENFLNSIETLPKDISRDFELMRELDRCCYYITNSIDIVLLIMTIIGSVLI